MVSISTRRIAQGAGILLAGTALGLSAFASPAYAGTGYPATNKPPVAKCSASLSGQTMSVSAQGTYDPEGQSLSYVWTFSDGTVVKNWTASHTFAQPGNYSATLTVTDYQGASATCTVNSSTPPPNPVCQNGAISGFIWYDGKLKSHNNYYDSGDEAPDDPVTIHLQGAGADGVFGTADDKNRSVWIDEDETDFSFSGLAAGKYRVSFEVDEDKTTWVTPHVSGGRFGSDVDDDGYAKVTLSPSTGCAATVKIGYYKMSSPIAVDLDGNGVRTTALDVSAGTFDLNADGNPVHSGWLSPGDAFLAVDRNHNRRIDSRTELFGGDETGQGFAQLAAFDSNRDGVVDAADHDFGSLLLWRDADSNHATDAGELTGLAEAGVTSLSTAYADRADRQAGNLLGETSTATRNGSSVELVDVWFATN